MKYAYTIERHKGKYWGSVIDLQVCVGSGRTLKALEDDIRAAIETWVESQAERGYEIPESRSHGDGSVDVTERTTQLIEASRLKHLSASANA